jgi:hypothetical protein
VSGPSPGLRDGLFVPSIVAWSFEALGQDTLSPQRTVKKDGCPQSTMRNLNLERGDRNPSAGNVQPKYLLRKYLNMSIDRSNDP